MADPTVTDTHQKALTINLDASLYGTLAEIGAGQEVSRWFLQVGGASGTVAKTISAYDMTFSDDIYGKVGRYVSRERLEGMLEKEFETLRESLAAKASDTCFFVFADTVSARNFSGTNECHGWLGMRFQTAPQTQPNDILLHVNLKDATNLLQQLAIGVLGVNLIYGARYLHNDLSSFLRSLFDELTLHRLEIDLIALAGPAFDGIDPRAALLALVHCGLTDAVLFPATGPARPPSEVLRKRPAVLEPGVFEEAGPIHAEMLRAAVAALAAEGDKQERDPIALFALTTRRPDEMEAADTNVLLQRVDNLLALGAGVLVIDRPEVYRVVEYVTRYTKEPIRLVSGIATLAQILQEQQYDRLDGRYLEALSKLFAFNVRMYVYPMAAADFRQVAHGIDAHTWIAPGHEGQIDAASLTPPAPVSHLYRYLIETGFLQSVSRS